VSDPRRLVDKLWSYCNVLRDDGEAYVRAMEEAGTRVVTLRFPSLGHGFLHMTGVVPSARRAMAAIAREWRALLG